MLHALRFLLIVALLVAPSAARAADVPAGTDLGGVRVAAHYAKRLGPRVVAFVLELVEMITGGDAPGPSPDPPADVDPPVHDPDFTP